MHLYVINTCVGRHMDASCLDGIGSLQATWTYVYYFLVRVFSSELLSWNVHPTKYLRTWQRTYLFSFL